VLAHTRFLQHRDVLSGRNHREIFQFIYETNMWGGETSRSGIGSSTTETGRLRFELPALLQRLGAKCLLDIPCSDFFWASQLALQPIRYLGADIVPAIIEGNRAVYGELPGIREFLLADLVGDRLPASDVVLCRDCLVHFSFANIRAALANTRASGAEWLLATTFPDHDTNEDIEDGDWRLLNLERPPFGFPPAVATVTEGCEEGNGAYGDKALGLWRLSDLPLI
jgi:hypothetical protein